MSARRRQTQPFVALGLLRRVLILTVVVLGWDRPDVRSPGHSEGGNDPQGYCPHCDRALKRRAGVLWCRKHGPVSESDARGSLSGGSE
jgi:hypothetical protein